MDDVDLSVVIPTRNRPDLLRDCLETLAGQESSHFEVVIVDDGSDVPLSECVGPVDGLAALRYVRTTPSGLNDARNAGIEQARSRLVAFLDDDTLVSPCWAGAVLAGFGRGADALAGRIQPRFEAPVPKWLAPSMHMYLSELDLGDSERWLDPPAVPYGANCAVRKDVASRIGGFRSGLDRIGTSLVSNGEVEFFLRLGREGGRILYTPDATVLHRVPAARLEKPFFTRRAYAQGVSDILMDPVPMGSRLRRDTIRAVRAVPIAARNVSRGNGIFPARVWLSYCWGRIRAKPR